MSYLLLKEGPAQRHPLLQLVQLPVVLSLCLHLDLALIGIEQLQFLLQLHLQDLALCFLRLVQSQLQDKSKQTELWKRAPGGRGKLVVRLAKKGRGRWKGLLTLVFKSLQ